MSVRRRAALLSCLALLRIAATSPAHLDDAVKVIEEACGEPVKLVEHHSDLTHWTARRLTRRSRR
ncbi:hypothetical protein E1193_08975 [Micromonospora sp. KC606]|uniref:hypothetical protein n=1 Tax=Micromonospora sp. KC606 TaxID=2530379 RepID=UPI0010482344|nr:hypothetical protein [Micromonospora sp. KC606]TDC83359.1 hypothetical protein E1193_08975 [Micromonospora sp. KC606]